MRIELGTIFKNTNPSHDAYFVFKKENGHYCEGLVIENLKGSWEARSGTFKTDDLLNMPHIYPVVGKLNVDAVIAAAVLAVINNTRSEEGADDIRQ